MFTSTQSQSIHTPYSWRYRANDIGLKLKSRSTESRLVVLSNEKSVIAALVSGGFAKTASMTAAPMPSSGIGAYTLIRVLCIACS